jgi:hypothetical protein
MSGGHCRTQVSACRCTAHTLSRLCGREASFEEGLRKVRPVNHPPRVRASFASFRVLLRKPHMRFARALMCGDIPDAIICAVSKLARHLVRNSYQGYQTIVTR